MEMTIGFATTNKHKLVETQACLSQWLPNAKLVSLAPDEDVEETGATFEANARLKLEACLNSSQLTADIDLVIAEDSGLIVPSLAGTCGLNPFPGVYAHRWYSMAVEQSIFPSIEDEITYSLINKGLLKLLELKTDRHAAYEACLAAWNRKNNTIKTYTGQMPLIVATASAGENGFGYDPIMIAYQYDPTRTVAQLSNEEKNKLSHRSQVLELLAQDLKIMS